MTRHAIDADRLVGGFRDFIADAEKLLRATAEYSGESLATARTRLQDGLEQARGVVADAESAAMVQAKKAAAGAERVAKDHPWGVAAAALVLGIAVAIGLMGASRNE